MSGRGSISQLYGEKERGDCLSSINQLTQVDVSLKMTEATAQHKETKMEMAK